MPTLLTATGTTYTKSTLAALFANQTISTGSWLTIVFSLALAFATGLFIYWIYRTNYRGVMYNNNFGLTLVLMTLITTPVVMCIRESIQLSMGMVGALSIVRFRTAVKDPMDIVFLFWAIIGGIVLGAGLIPLAIFGSLFVGLVLILALNRKSRDIPYMLMLNLDGGAAESEAAELVKKNTQRTVVKSKSVSGEGIELTFEVRLSGDATAFVNELNALSGVKSAVLVASGGEALA